MLLLMYVCVSDRKGTQVAVTLYGEKPVEAVSWRDTQSTENLLQLVDKLQTNPDTSPKLGTCSIKLPIAGFTNGSELHSNVLWFRTGPKGSKRSSTENNLS